MSSTLTLCAAPAAAAVPASWPTAAGREALLGAALGSTLVDAVLLPAATDAPAALVIAVDAPVSQETSVLVQDVVADGAANGSNGSDNGMSADLLAAYAAPVAVVPAAAFRTRKHVQGPPSRGTPV